MRGKLQCHLKLLLVHRITPAHAGKTHREAPYRAPEEDHPRACGENSDVDDEGDIIRGSPPRMRGKQGWTASMLKKGRITPAHAGKTDSTRLCRTRSRDHPRACGENMMADTCVA